MLYDAFGIFVGGDDREDKTWTGEWRMTNGYAAFGNSDIRVGDTIEHDGMQKRVTGIREAHLEKFGDGYFALLEDGSQKFFKHYGTPRHSGRYPWGSGKNPYQRNQDFLGRVYKMREEKGPDGKRLFTDKQIAESMNMNTADLRKRISLANAENAKYRNDEVMRLYDKGMSKSAIARRMGMPESTVRNMIKSGSGERMTIPLKNAQLLKERLEEVPYIQVGAGTEYFLNNATSTSLRTTLKALENEGYMIHNIQVEQMGTGKMTTVKVLTKPGVEAKDIHANLDKVGMPMDIYEEAGELKKGREFVSVDPSRVMIRYDEQGGTEKDGLIEVRRGVEDLSLGKNNYVQGRILVDGDHYIKGMVAYADDLPPGIDIRFNTNKHEGTPMINRENENNGVLKPIKNDPENIFGANLKPDEKLLRVQREYIDSKTGEKKVSAINIVKEEGDVDEWNKTLPSQFLSKQPPKLAEQQLQTSRDILNAQFDEIKSYNNPVVQAKMLEDFAGRCERDSVHLAGAALPRQKTKFILPLDNVADNEVYAPGFRDGEEVALVRFPHGSITEIPVLKVNNNNKAARQKYGDALDAVGINHHVAAQLSGADFDGDTVLVLPTGTVNIAHDKQLKGLKNFDTQQYRNINLPKMTDQQHGLEMGKVSNLITDMTIKGASSDEIERALKHSMVIVDSKKHPLDWKRSEQENRIPELQERYQKAGGGASTFLSRSTGDEYINERKLKAPSFIKKNSEEYARWKNGEQIWEETGRTRRETSPIKKLLTKEEKEAWNKAEAEKDYDTMGNLKKKFFEEGKMRVKDVKVQESIERGYIHKPEELTSTKDLETARPIERIYAKHASELQDMAREARKLQRSLEMPKADSAAKLKYANEVTSLDAKLAVAERNRPLERMAQVKSNQEYKEWWSAHKGEDSEHQKRKRNELLDKNRKRFGAKKLQIGTEKNPLTEKEWEAIQNRAISPTKLKKILDNCDMTVVKQYALPKEKHGLSNAELARAKMYLSKGYTRAEVCDMLDISETTLINAVGKANI